MLLNEINKTHGCGLSHYTTHSVLYVLPLLTQRITEGLKRLT